MATIGKWKSHKFKISSDKIEIFKNIQIKGGSNLKENKKKKKSVVKRDKAKPLEISLTVELNAFVGCNVRHDGLLLVKEATNGAKDYFYIGKKKLMTCKLMLVDAALKNPEFAPNGTWTKAEVTLTLKQCTKGNVNVSGGGGEGGGKKKKKKKKKGSKKVSARATSPVSSPSYGGGSGGSSGGKGKIHGKAPEIASSGKIQGKATTVSRDATKSANQDAKSYIYGGKSASTSQLNQLKKT